MFGMQHAVFGEPGAAGCRFCDVEGRIRALFDRGIELQPEEIIRRAVMPMRVENQVRS